MKLRENIRILRSRWLSISVLALVGMGSAGVVTLLSPKVYQAQTQFFVAITNQSSNTSTNQILSGSQFTLERVSSYTAIATSARVLQPVIDQLHLGESASELASRVSAVSPPNSVLINLTVTDSSPAQAAIVCNAVAAQFSSVVETLETPIGSSSAPVKVTVVDEATPQTTPVSPRPKINLVLGLLVGLAVGIGLALVREILDTRVNGPQDLQRATDATPLGVVVYDPEGATRPLAALDHASPRSEAFRTIRTNLQFVDVDNVPRVVVITSAVPEEGKTTTACNLAIAMAQSGLKVCLVEGDLRRPRVAEYLGIDGTVGLANVLAGQVPLREALVYWPPGSLHALPSGTVPPNPSEMLGSKHMMSVIGDLRTHFDAVIIDAPPLLLVTDGSILSAASDGAIVIVRHGKTTREQLDRAVESLAQVDARLLGTVLNFAPQQRGRQGYGYGYGYGAYSSAQTVPTTKGRHGAKERAAAREKQLRG